MTKRRRVKSRVAKPPATDVPARSKAVRGLSVAVLIFVAGFALAFLLARFLFLPGEDVVAGPTAAEAEKEMRTLTAADLTEFLRAVESRDFAAMSRLGDELFKPGYVVRRDGGVLLEPYAVGSFPPHQVYALFTSIGGPTSFRVLLTLEGDKVTSFMAEEVSIAGTDS